MSTQITSASSGLGSPAATFASMPVSTRSASPEGASSQAVGQGTAPVAGEAGQQVQEAGRTDTKLQVDAGSGRPVFQVVEQGTGEVLLQVPSAEVLGLSRRLRAMASQSGAPGVPSGALVDREG